MRKLIIIPSLVLLSIGSVLIYLGLRAYLYPQSLGSIQGGLGVTVLGLLIAIVGAFLAMSGVFLEGGKEKTQRSSETASKIRRLSLVREKKRAILVYDLFVLLLMSILATGTVKADPSIPKITPSGDNPVNVLWRGNGYATLVTAQIIDFGWEMGDTLSENDAFAMLMWKVGPFARWYMWIYEGGFSEEYDWGYWSYASVAHYKFDPNPLHWGWYLDDWEGAQDMVHLQWRDESTPWGIAVDYYYLDNDGQYHGVWSDDYASIVDIAYYASCEETILWTTNSRFRLDSQSNYWDTVTYCWDWNLIDTKYQGNTWEVSNSETHYAEWNQDGLVKLSAEDTVQLDTIGNASRVTYGPFKAVDYPFYPPSELCMHLTSNVCLLGAVSNYGTEESGGTSWTGIKFDAWFRDPENNDRPLVIEMYFTGTGIQMLWGNELKRTLANNTVDDYMFKLQAFPEYAQIIGSIPYSLGTNGEWKSTVFLIDLKGIYNRVKGYFQRSDSDLLYAVALDLESGIGIVGNAGRVWAEANQIRVTYSLPPPPPPPPPPHGGGHGCPYVSTWNGTHWLLDNNLIPSAEYTNGTDITDFYRLQQPLAREDGKYSLKIWDLDKHSFLDQVKLLAVDHESDVNIAVSPYGEILTYKNPAPLVTAIDQDNQDVSSILNTVDENYYEGNAGDSILIDFGNLDVSKSAKLVLRTDYCPFFPCKMPYSIHILNASGGWIDVASVIPRMYWSTDIVDLSDYLPDGNGEVKLKLYFTATHKIDYVGMDTTKQGEFELSYANLVTAIHNQAGDVKELLKDSDNLRVELLPDEYVTLQFTAPQLQEEKRDFIIILEGHYFIIS